MPDKSITGLLFYYAYLNPDNVSLTYAFLIDTLTVVICIDRL